MKKQALASQTPVRVRFRAFSLGVGASVLAAACSFGEIEDPVDPFDDVPVNEVPNNSGNTDGETPIADDGNTSRPTPDAPGVDAEEPTKDYDVNDQFTTDIGRQVKAILETNCGGCHANGAATGGFGYLLDFEELVTSGKLVEGSKEDSQLFVRMQQQSMPPAFIQNQRPTFGQIDVVGQWIDQMEPAADTNCPDYPLVSFDDMIEAMADDISGLDDRDKPFARYLTITYESNNAESCERAVQRQRYALFKGINSVSTEVNVGQPQPIDDDKLIYRIDIRDYNWDREIDLLDDGTILFQDGWEAIVDGGTVNAARQLIPNTNEYAVEFVGDQADDLKDDAGTAVPFMPVNAFIQFTEVNDLYYALIGARANLFDFEREVLNIDTAQEILDENLLRAGFSNSGVSKQERVLNRFDNGVSGNLAYWISFDFDGGNGNGELSVANESIYDDPLGFQFAGGEAIFNLPNGFQAYYVAAADGTRLGEAPVGVVIDPAQNNGVVVNGASCHSCHNAGMITFTDTVKPYVMANKFDFDNETYEAVLAVYPDPPEFQAAMDRDSRLHMEAVEEAGVPMGEADPISRVFLDFQLGDVTLEIAAAELGVTPEDLLGELSNLDPKLQNFETEGVIDRAVFTDVYLDSLCVLQVVAENQPLNCP